MLAAGRVTGQKRSLFVLRGGRKSHASTYPCSRLAAKSTSVNVPLPISSTATHHRPAPARHPPSHPSSHIHRTASSRTRTCTPPRAPRHPRSSSACRTRSTAHSSSSRASRCRSIGRASSRQLTSRAQGAAPRFRHGSRGGRQSAGSARMSRLYRIARWSIGDYILTPPLFATATVCQ